MSDIIWQDFDADRYDIIRGGLSGQSGDMPQELHLIKMEQTQMYEHEDQLDDFFRSTLRDTTPDAPTLAQDMPRKTQDTLRSEILNIRYTGARTAAEPIHPDLFLGFTRRDERGYHNAGPDMRHANSQSMARVKYKDFVSDHASDWTITSGGRSEMRAIRDLRSTIGATKQRLKIFSTSKDSRATPYQGASHHKSHVNKLMSDGVALSLNNIAGAHQRKNNSTLKSNVIRAGHRQTGDHEFSVAQYGILSSAKKRANIHSAQRDTSFDHVYDVAPGEIKNRLSVVILQEKNRRKHLNQYKREMNPDFKDSIATKNVIKKLMVDLTAAQNSTVQTTDVVELGYVNRNAQTVRVFDPSHSDVIVDRDIFEKVKENKNVTFVKRTNLLARRDARIDDITCHETSAFVYQRQNIKNRVNLPVKMEQEWYKSDPNIVYKKGKYSRGVLNHNYTEEAHGINPSEGRVFDRMSKAAGYHQKARTMIDKDLDVAPISDSVSRV